MAETASIRQSYDAWTEHKSGTRTDSEFVVHEILRKAYPHYHLTRTAPTRCDLLAFAAAGHATAIRENDAAAGYDALRVYKASGSRLDKTPSKLDDNVRFGRWTYEWEDNDFVVYEATWENKFLQKVARLYILAPFSKDEVVGGYHKATDALLLASGAWTRELHEEVYVFDSSEWLKDKSLWKSVQNSSWDDVILDPKMKRTLIDDVQGFFDNQELYQNMNIPWKRGVIFHGVPGNGKTISIKALINSLAARPNPVQSLYVKSLDSCSGLKWSIQTIFKHARLMAPCLLIFEDLDSLVQDETRGYFLNEVDGLESNDGILMIGSTNHLDQIDSAITKRPSRFDRKYHFKIPSEEDRVEYCRYWCRKFAKSSTVDFPDEICPLVAKMTEEYSFAYLKELFVTSLLILARDGTNKQDDAGPLQYSSGVSDTTSTSDGVVVESMADTSEVEEGAKTDTMISESKKDGKDVPEEKVQRIMAEVDIPEHLQGNKLLMIIQAQAKLLLEEMDNATNEAAKKAPACGPNAFSRAMAQFMPSRDD